MGSPAGHPVILERSRRIESLVLERDPVEPAVVCRDRPVQKRRVPFAQSDHVPVVVEKRKQLAIPPDAALVEKRIARSPLSPGFSEILVPGEFEHREQNKRRASGIMLEEETWKKLQETASDAGVQV